jgi:hypothetical protein
MQAAPMRDGMCGGLYGHALLSASSLNTPRALINGITTSQSVGRLTSPVAKHVCWLALGAKCEGKASHWPWPHP